MKDETVRVIETDPCLTALISSRAISFPTHLLMEGDHQVWCITTYAELFLRGKPHLYVVVLKPMMVGLP